MEKQALIIECLTEQFDEFEKDSQNSQPLESKVCEIESKLSNLKMNVELGKYTKTVNELIQN